LPIAAKFRAFGWEYRQIGRNIDTEPFKSVGLVAGTTPNIRSPFDIDYAGFRSSLEHRVLAPSRAATRRKARLQGESYECALHEMAE
jgi:hypothetical protein